MTSVGNGAFKDCSNLAYITIGNNVTSIGDNTFEGCSSLTSVTIPNSVTSIGNSVFYGCSGLTSITIGNSVTSIGSFAFAHCSSLSSISIPNSISNMGGFVFSGCSSLTLATIKCASVGDWFYNLTSIKEVILGDEVTSIGNSAFYGCSGLTSVIIPNSVTSIGENAFFNTRLKSVTIGTGVLSIGKKAFSYNKTTGHTDGENPIKVIWLTNTPPTGYKNVDGIMNYVSNDSYANLSRKEVYPFLSSLFEVNGVKYVPVSPSKRTCDVIDCIYDETTENVNIGERVSYKGVDMTVKNVKCYTFYDNTFIRKANLSFNGALEDCAFQNCSGITTVSLGEKITSIGEYAFFGCSSLPTIVIPQTVTSIGNCAFSRCSTLSKIVIPQAVMSIGHYAFQGCTKLTNVNIADSHNDNTTLSLGCNGSLPLFADCPLEEVYIGRNISYSTSSSYGYSPFYRNTTLKTVTITDKETEISTNEFYGCTSLQNVTIGDGVTTIGDRAFSGCSSLDYFACGSHVTNIGQEAFSDCTAMTKFISHATVPPVCRSQALDDISKWICTLQVPENSINLYKVADQWKDFFFVEPTGINNLENGKKEVLEVVKNYNLKGQPLVHPHKGVNIIKGKKILVK